MSRDSSIGIATSYWLDGPGIESRWGTRFSALVCTDPGPTQPPIPWVPSFSRGVKRPGCGFDHPPTPRAEVKKRVKLYIYSPSGTWWPVLGRNLPWRYMSTMFYLLGNMLVGFSLLFGSRKHTCDFAEATAVLPTFHITGSLFCVRIYQWEVISC